MYYTPESEGRAPEAELRPLKWTLLEDTAPRADPQRKLHRLAAALSTLAGTHAALASCKGGVTNYTRRAGRARRQRKPARKTFVWARPARHFVISSIRRRSTCCGAFCLTPVRLGGRKNTCRADDGGGRTIMVTDTVATWVRAVRSYGHVRLGACGSKLAHRA